MPLIEPSWGAVVLAAGASSRLGIPKQRVVWEGEPLVARAAHACLGAGFWPVVVVLGAHESAVRPVLARLPVLTVSHAAWAEGMASSLRAGLTALDQFSRTLPGALIALCDQPAFDAALAAELRRAAQLSPAGAAASRYEGHLGVPAAFTRAHFPSLAALSGDQGARLLLARLGPSLPFVEAPALALDIDTPADLPSPPPPPERADIPGSPANRAIPSAVPAAGGRSQSLPPPRPPAP